ncbi:DUF808 domain-containing protein [Leucobacter triazinivorans]|uniref:DUF808 domain-containing protein n=1 Tax=Leucobacter triazinivorans TaxID=1784719 RepID=A0A4P6KGR0_9MICO|nr:DUF808 domain-containing protein [Leucobacter triazinivorans]QBE49460.1 DUF808 domain-containing protein [Leucobacter triazinivorans]
MSSSFFALFDDIAVLAKAAAASIDDIAAGAAKASAKAAGVVIDDAAVTPQYVRGINPKRELPVIWRIARGSLVNKAIIITAIMLLSVWAPWVFPWMLLIGGTYLAFEGTEKVWHWIETARGREREHTVEEVIQRPAIDEKQIVGSAVRTDLVLSAEIMLISLANIDADGWLMRLMILIAVGLSMTGAVYGAVALLVKMDDAGLWLMRRRGPRGLRGFGLGLVRAMPAVFRIVSVVGVVAMLWVGGHLLIANLHEVGWHLPHDLVHGATHAVHATGFAAWLIDSALSAVFGLAWGAVVVAAVSAGRRVRRRLSRA